MNTSTHTPFGFNPFSTPRTPKGYARLSSDAEPVSPLARFNRTRASGGKELGDLGELPSLRVWKETCKAFHVNTSGTPSSISSTTATTTTKKNSTNKSRSKPPAPAPTTKRPYPLPYGSFDRAMLLEDRDVFRVSASASDEEGEFGDSFNVYATKTKRRGVVKKSSK